MFRSRISITTGLLTIWVAEALAQPAPLNAVPGSVAGAAATGSPPPALADLSAGPAGARPAGWALVTLPRQSVPVTDLRVERTRAAPPRDGQAPAGNLSALALRIESRASYGAWVHDWPERPSASPQWRLSWAWRLDQPLAQADLLTRAGDDAALKVCLMFDPPLSALPFGERARLQIARAVSGQHLPGATLCYVWDKQLAAGTVLPNAHSARVRYWVLDGPGSSVGTWQWHTRTVVADLLQAFGSEVTPNVPLLGIAVGADSDNTGGHGLGWVAALAWER